MSRHPDSVLIRRMLCGPIGTAKLKELSTPSNDESGDLSKASHASLSACCKSGPHAGTTAPVASLCPPIATGAFLDTPVHGETYAE